VVSLLLLLCMLFPLTAHAKGVILNFTDVDIATMVKFISDLTGKNFVMDEKVKGKISVYSPAKLSNEEAFNVFTAVLELKGFTLIQSGKVYKIVPTATAKQSGTKLYGDKDKVPVNESYVARIITLENIPAQDAVTFLQPIVSKDGHVSAFGAANMLLVVDSAMNMQKIIAIVEMIDAEKRRELPEVIYLKNAGAENVAKVLQDWAGSRSAKQPGQTTVSSVGITVVPDTRLNAVLVFGAEKDKEEIRKLVALVDVPPPTSSGKVNVYYLENGDATDIAKVLDGVVKGSAAQVQPGQAAAPQSSPFDVGKITITPYKATNSLVVMASPTDYQNLLQVIQKLDRKRRQVFVQALIAEVSLDRLKTLGVQWGAIAGGANKTATAAGIYDPQNVISSVLGAVTALSQSGISIPDLGTKTPLNFAVALQALETNGILNVLSTPSIMTSDNKEAEIFVGENVPFRGSITFNASLPNSPQQAIDRKDTGITLKLTPQISEGEYVKMDIYQEISAVKDATSTGAAADITTTKRSAKTSVVVKDTDTVAIGGLIQDKDQETISKVPFFGDIPLLGWFFKTRSITRQKTNLLILLTPKIIKNPGDLNDVSQQMKIKFNDAARKSEPLNIPAELNIKPADKGQTPETGGK